MSTATTVLSNRFLPFSVMMHGLDGSGKSACEVQLGLSNDSQSRSAFTIDDRFLTSPQIYSANYQHPNKPRSSNRNIIEGQSSVWKYGGRGSVHAKWSLLLEKSEAHVFVVDSTDRARLAPLSTFQPLPLDYVIGYENRSKEEQAEMFSLLQSQMTAKSLFDNLRKEIGDYDEKPILVLATKQDMDGAMSVQEICDILGLKSLSMIDWRIIGVDASTGEGFDEAIGWLKRVVKTPSDFTVARYERDEERDVEDTLEWVRFSQRSIQRLHTFGRLERGDVLPAPPLYRTNGTIVKVHPEQSKEYVLAPLTPDTFESMTTLYNKQVENIRSHQKNNAKKSERLEALMPLPISERIQLQEKQFQEAKHRAEEIEVELQESEASDSEGDDVASNASTVTGTPEASSESDAESSLGDGPDDGYLLVNKKRSFFSSEKKLGFEQQSRAGVAVAN